MGRQTDPPTVEQFFRYQLAWQWFNNELFGGTLQPCLLNFSRHRGSYGFFAPHRWQQGTDVIHEISLNPDYLDEPIAEIMSTLGHEMVHQWQQDHGTPPRRGYHNTEWAKKMVEIGLVPSETGEPGGQPTGQRMSHFIDPKGLFSRSLKRMPKEYRLPWISQGPKVLDKSKKRRRPKFYFVCPACRIRITAEVDDLNAICDDCNKYFLSLDELREVGALE